MRTASVVFMALLASASVLPAQHVHGVIVSDSAAAPISNVLIMLMNEKGDTLESMRSDENGKFALRTKNPGRYLLRASRLAFEPATSVPFDLAMRTIVDVKLVMTRLSVLLSPMVVVGSRVMTGSDMMTAEGFEWRRRRYTGVFSDTAAIRKAGYPPFTQFLRQVIPGLTTAPGFTGNEELRITVLGGLCTPDLYRDGSLQGTMVTQHLNNTNSADFYGIEVYRRPNIPIEFRRQGTATVGGSGGQLAGDCAVVAVWTKWGARERGARAGGG